MEAHRTHRRYDHRLRRLVHDTGNIQLALRNGVPRSTARDWFRLPSKDVVTLDVCSMSESALQQEVVGLRARNAKLVAMLRLVVVLLRVCDVTLARRRISDGDKKRRIFRAVGRSRASIPLRAALRLRGLSASIYHSWRRDEECTLDDVSSCPQSRLNRSLPTSARPSARELVAFSKRS